MADNKDLNERSLDTANEDTKVWLVKCPKILDVSIKASGAHGIIGKVVETVDPLDPNRAIQYTFVPHGEKGPVAPYSMIMELEDFSEALHVFSENNEGKVALEGQVSKKFSMHPNVEDVKYCEELRKRAQRSSRSKRQVQVIDQCLTPRPPTAMSFPKVTKDPIKKKVKQRDPIIDSNDERENMERANQQARREISRDVKGWE